MPDMNMQTFEELQRHQLVTEFDIQSQAELEGYQVKLDNVDNPTQAQDNLVVGVNSESLPHWNESVDFDTWVKMRIETSGKRGLLIHGNDGLDGESSISGTFIAGSELNDLTGFTEFGSGSITDGVYTSQVGGASDWYGVIWNISFGTDYILEAKVNADGDFPFVGMTDEIANENYTSTTDSISHAIKENIGSYYILSKAAGAINEVDITDYPNASGPWIMRTDRISTTSVKYYVNDHLVHTETTRVPTVDLYPRFTGYTSVGEIVLDYFFLRKYTATEPTVQISTPKNISTALKIFGRAG